jgi:hypothetical protein
MIQQQARHRPTRLWPILTLVLLGWCGFIGVLAYDEWREHQNAVTSLQSLRLFQNDASNTPLIGLYIPDLTQLALDRVQHSQTMLWYYGAIALVPSIAIFLMGWIGARIGAALRQQSLRRFPTTGAA